MPRNLGCLAVFFAAVTGNALYGLAKIIGTSLNGPFLGAVLLLDLAALKVLFFKGASGYSRRKAVASRLRAGEGFLLTACLWAALVWAGNLLKAWWAHVPLALTHPLPLNAMEGREPVKAWLMTHGVNIYPAMDAHPFLVTIYPPGYHAAVAGLSAFLGWDIATARIVSLTSFAALCAVACVAVLRTGRHTLAAGVILLATLFDPVLSEWSLHARPDMLAWALALAGAWVFSEACAAARRRDLLAACAGVLWCLALFTKQQTLPWPLGCLAWAAFKGRAAWRPGAVALAACAGLGALAAGAMELASGGHFLRDVALYPALMGSIPGVSTTENLLVRLGQVWDAFRALWILLAAALAWAAWKRAWSLPVVLAVVNAAFLVKLMASWGADINYAFGTVAAALWCVGNLLGNVLDRRRYGPALVLAVLFLWLPAPSQRPERPAPDVSFLTGLTGRILANTEGGHLFTGRVPDREVVFFDGIETQLYERTGRWDSRQARLATDIRDRAFDRLVFHGDFMPPAVADAARVSYKVVERRDHYTVHAPLGHAVIADMDPSGQARASGRGRVALAALESLAWETEGLAQADRSRAGVLRLRIEAGADLRRAQAQANLRVDPGDPAAAATMRIEDGQGRVLAQAKAQPGASELSLTAEGVGRAAELVVEVSGRAWIETGRGSLAVVRAGE